MTTTSCAIVTLSMRNIPTMSSHRSVRLAVSTTANVVGVVEEAVPGRVHLPLHFAFVTGLVPQPLLLHLLSVVPHLWWLQRIQQLRFPSLLFHLRWLQ